jgi:hypothetical protein
VLVAFFTLSQGDYVMNLKPLIAALILSIVSVPAFAFHCPSDMKKIDAALEGGPQLGMSELKQVKQWRAEGEAYHKAGEHQKSVDTLARAMEMLGIE